MIFTFLFTGLINIVSYIFSYWPQVTSLPFGADAFLQYCINVVFAFTSVFWPLQPVIAALIWYMGLKVTLLILRLIFGMRVPAI